MAPTDTAGGVAGRLGALAAPVGTALGALVAVGVLAVRGPHVPGVICPTRAVTGLDCPGCGATRSVAALAGGDLTGALDHHLLVPVVLVALAWAWLSWLVARWRRVALWHPLAWRWAGPVTLAVATLFTVARNVDRLGGGFLASEASLG